MKDKNKTKAQLIAELEEMRRRVSESEKNNTDRKQAEEALRRSEEKHKAYIENSPGAIFVCDSSGKYIDVNSVACLMTGYSREELLNMSISDLAPSDAPPEAFKPFNELIVKRKVEAEVILQKKDGTRFHSSLDAVALSDNGFLAYCFDINERKKAEDALRESEEKFSSLFSGMAAGVYFHEIIYNQKGEAVDYRIIETNPASEKHLNIKSEDANGKLATELYGREEAPYLDIYAKVAKTGIPFNFEEYFHPMKKHFHISVYSPEKGKFATIFSDITKRKIAEEASLQSQHDLGERVKELKGLSKLRQLTDMNLSYGELFSKFLRDILLPSMQFPEKTIARIVFDGKEYYGDEKRDITNCFSVAINVRGKKIGELQIGYSDDSGFIPEFEQNLANGYVTIIKHYLERKEYEQQIKSSLEEKTVLLQEVHHGVKNKLFTVMSLVDMQIEPYEEKDVMFKGDKVICDALMAFKHRVQVMATAHEMLYESESLAEIKYDEYINKRVQSLLQTYHVPGVVLEGNIDPNISLDIDKAGHLGLVVNELVTNTLKYAFPKTYELPGGGSKRISIDFLDNGNEYLLNVSDNGIGMPGDFKLEEINSLGLKLVYGLVTVQLDGTIELVKRDIGTRFEIILPKTYKGRS